MSGDMSPEELAALFHGPEATVGPEARRQCMVCRKPQGGMGYDMLGRGLCDKCERKHSEKVSRDAREEQKRLRKAHFSPEQLKADQERERLNAAYHQSAQQHQREQEQRREAKRKRDDEYHRQLAAWSDGHEQRDHQKRMAALSRQDAAYSTAITQLHGAHPTDAEISQLNAPFLFKREGFWIGFALGAIAGGILFAIKSHYDRKRVIA